MTSPWAFGSHLFLFVCCLKKQNKTKQNKNTSRWTDRRTDGWTDRHRQTNKNMFEIQLAVYIWFHFASLICCSFVVWLFAKTLVKKLMLKVLVRLKKINPMSQSCRAHLFFGARLIQQNSKFEFFLLAWFFFFSFLWLAKLSKNTRKDITDTMKHFEQQTSSTLVFCLVSCSSKIKFHISKLWPTQIWHVCCSEKKKKKKKKR